MNKIYNCFICNKKVRFENDDNTIEEYTLNDEGIKYCSKCFERNEENE